jgi:hypothetical protein
MNTQNRDQRLTREMARSMAEQGLMSDNGAGPQSEHPLDKFPEPQGWALKWDGFVLSEAQERQNARSRSRR